jgi:hypothetical protein
MKLTKVPAILGILTTALAVGGWVHLHAETTIEEADLEQRRLIDMNTAEFTDDAAAGNGRELYVAN